MKDVLWTDSVSSLQMTFALQTGTDSSVGPSAPLGLLPRFPAHRTSTTSITKVVPPSTLELYFTLCSSNANNIRANTCCKCFKYVFTGFAYRKCDANGSWVFVEQLNRTWANYSECLRFLQPSDEEERVSEAGKHFKQLLMWWTDPNRMCKDTWVNTQTCNPAGSFRRADVGADVLSCEDTICWWGGFFDTVLRYGSSRCFLPDLRIRR